MSTEEIIRTRFPYHLAKIYETTRLESDPRLRVQKLIGLFEETLRYLGLVGLAETTRRGVSDTGLVKARSDLDRPSLGHWLNLVRAADSSLQTAGAPFITPPLNQIYKDGPIWDAVQRMAPLAGLEIPGKVRGVVFLDSLVQFRNKKIGHGTLSNLEARQVIESLEAAIIQWLAGLSILQNTHLVYIERVEWQDPRFVYVGTDLNSGTSLYPARLEGDQKIAPRRIYLSLAESPALASFTSLYPFFAFDPDSYLLYAYHELSAKRKTILRCAYEPSSLKNTLEVDVPLELVIGAESITVNPAEASEYELTPIHHEPETINPPASKDMPFMKNWYEIIPPHEDIRKGHFDEAVFAADLDDVSNGTAPADYRDPYLFFKKTYPTQGLKNLLARVQGKLRDGEGASVVQIQTPFGGGKTHALVAIYHYLKHGVKVKELLPAGMEILNPKVAVIAGNHWDPVGGRTTDGITRRTFWGEIAYQIGGRVGYELFRENDEARVSPGKDKLRELLEPHQPFILLFDEILEYINRALDARGGLDVSLGTQTFSFFQELTDTVATLPRGLLVATLPSSHLEDYGEKGEESLARLNKIFGRRESIETPVQGEEVYAVVRRRLFEVEHLQQAEMRAIVHRYFQLYQQYRDDLPAKARDLNYREKMELAYPFHPDVIDILYEKWSTFSTFQRTRGVLRMLANVVEELYQSEAPLDLILPGDINLERPAIRQEFLKHIGMEYEGVIGSDIAGHEAKSRLLDSANKPWKHLAQRISTAVFFHSFSADDADRGINLAYIKLAVLHADTIPALATDVLGKLDNTLWYLNSSGDAHYFSRIPNLNRMILDKKELFNESYENELKVIVEKEIGPKFRPYLWPEISDGIPDNRELKLIILRPDDSGARIPDWIERRGNSFREYKNTLFFALADTAAFAKLKEDVKTLLALQEIESEIKSGKNPLLESKRDEVSRRMRDLQRDFSYNVRRMYHTLHVGNRKIDLGQPVAGNETLSNWFWRELTSSDVGVVLTQLHYRTIVNKFMLNNDQLATGVLLEQFYKNPELPVPSEQGVIARAIQLGVSDKEGALGLAEVKDGEVVIESLKYKTDISLDAITFEAGFFLISRQKCEAIVALLQAQKQVELEISGKDEPKPDVKPDDRVSGGSVSGSASDKPSPTLPTPEQRYKHIHLRVTDIPSSKIADVNRGILMPISAAVGEFKFVIEVEVNSEDGISQATLENKIKETIRQIGAKVAREDIG